MCTVAPTLEPAVGKTVTLLDYFSPPALAFTLVNEEGQLRAIQENYSPQVHGDTSPRTQIIDTFTKPGPDPPSDFGIPKEGTILRSALQAVRLILGSQPERVDSGLRDEELSNIPKRYRGAVRAAHYSSRLASRTTAI